MHVSLLLISWTMTMSDAQPGSMDGADSEPDRNTLTCSGRQGAKSLLNKFVNKYGHWWHFLKRGKCKRSTCAFIIVQVKVFFIGPSCPLWTGLQGGRSSQAFGERKKITSILSSDVYLLIRDKKTLFFFAWYQNRNKKGSFYLVLPGFYLVLPSFY